MTPLEVRLADLASRRQTITYGALARALDMRIGTLTADLERLMEADAVSNSPFRAAICTSRLSEGLPALGFFQKATALGRLPTNATQDEGAAFVAAERAALFSAAR